MEEIWKPVDSYEGLYEVSNKGRVRRCARSFSYSRSGKFHNSDTFVKLDDMIMKPSWQNHGTGHPRYMMQLRKNNRTRLVPLHRIVANAFLPNPDNLVLIAHLDGDYRNNCVSNLKWCTYSEFYDLKHSKGDSQ